MKMNGRSSYAVSDLKIHNQLELCIYFLDAWNVLVTTSRYTVHQYWNSWNASDSESKIKWNQKKTFLIVFFKRSHKTHPSLSTDETWHNRQTLQQGRQNVRSLQSWRYSPALGNQLKSSAACLVHWYNIHSTRSSTDQLLLAVFKQKFLDCLWG